MVELLGRGGMGEVWRAHDTAANNRVVAIKLLPSHLAADETFVRRFRREADAAARLTNPHIVPIHNYGEIDGRLYVDMRLIDGRDLQHVLAAGPLEPGRAVRIIEQVAKALHAAHKIGLVHRDVKPSNILVDEDDFAYLIDFGIARATDETGLTSTGSVIGTWHYMAPERLGAHKADARSDIYALACVLFECLTGERPFPGDSVESQVAGHLTAPPPQPSANHPDLPAELDAVIRDGMAKDPDDRFQSTVELARAAREAITVPTSRPASVDSTVAWQAVTYAGTAHTESASGTGGEAAGEVSPFAATQLSSSPVLPTPEPDRWWRRTKVVIPIAVIAALVVVAAVVIGVLVAPGGGNQVGSTATALPSSTAPQRTAALPSPTSTTPSTSPPPPAPAPGADFNGAYANSPSGSTWAVTPCGPGCANITSSAGWSGQAHLADGKWTMAVHRADAVNCYTGGKASGTTNFTIDAVTLNGTAVGTTDGPACGYSTSHTGDPSVFTLTKVG